jgi:dihydrofolate reductase/thymidylate synthase
MKPFAVVVAAATKSSNGIGIDGKIPWHIPADLKFFQGLTSHSDPNMINAVVMGRKTWESLPPKYRPLKNRLNVVITRHPNARTEYCLPDEVVVADSLSRALILLANSEDYPTLEKVFIIGGESIYREALGLSQCVKIYLTEILSAHIRADTFFPVIPANQFRLTSRSPIHYHDEIPYRFTEYESYPEDYEMLVGTTSTAAASIGSPVGNAEEQCYLDAIRDILANGIVRGDRTGTGTISKFGLQMRFNLRNNSFPLLTTKKVFWRGVAEELVWFVHGRTNGKELSDKGIHIWDGNGSREFLDSRGLKEREVGDLGPVYGFQVRERGFFLFLF